MDEPPLGELLDEIISPDPEDGVRAPFVTPGKPEPLGSLQNPRILPAVRREKERWRQLVVVEGAEAEYMAAGCGDRLDVHDTDFQEPAVCNGVRTGGMLADPILEAAEERPSVR